ncbi:Rieske (2Fe-2S) protein [Streptomyces vilmorinianum]|uniref:Rieske (2Fe-2S) protein n=1 Tax=Streptomyces vilmorinianum TaxID=3051092 RepID=UPI0010FB26CD|nr:Rieske (2Fe-2S) protein [Streptomyces vilmorinianum]
MTSDATPRRTVLLAGAGSVTAALATGCGSDGDKEGGTTAGPTTPLPTGPTTPGTAPAGTSLGSTSQIPVGGGTVFKDEKVVVTQPTDGEFKAFSAVCTHQGCTVNKVANGTIDCPCHGSKYRIADGSVAAGPAPRPLPAEEITVSGDTITLA